MRILVAEFNIDHHSMPLARRLHALLPQGSFAYAGLAPLSAERRGIGWDSGEFEPWMIPTWRSNKDATVFQDWWENADIVMCNWKLYALMKGRIRNRKYIFYPTERWFKPPLGMARFLNPRWTRQALQFRQMAQTQYMHYLPIGRYAASDMKRWISMTDKMWHWAYFLEPASCSSEQGNEAGFGVFWAGRMLGWKRVDTLILGFAQFVQQRTDAKLTLMGQGPEKSRLIRLASKQLPDGSYSFLPPASPAEVRSRMRNSQVYALPSNGFEGWGAVVSEAMSEGCAIVAAEEIGAAKTLIRDRSNGMLFHSGDWRRLAGILSELGTDETMRRRLAKAGQETVNNLWSPATAAERFIAVADALLSRRAVPIYNGGPMQLA
jgi:glycosyltransferase involved in cell wall biosynthesis